eukprot:6410125-Karenia_brevis.AAC.1
MVEQGSTYPHIPKVLQYDPRSGPNITPWPQALPARDATGQGAGGAKGCDDDDYDDNDDGRSWGSQGLSDTCTGGAKGCENDDENSAEECSSGSTGPNDDDDDDDNEDPWGDPDDEDPIKYLQLAIE